ncbi:MAG: DNA polymerase [Prevotella sp.]|nr:DNA polymerase [Prevotella sp.]
MTSWIKPERRLLFIDIETYSETDLKECGVYRYCEDPAFEVDLFGYAYGEEKVKIIDLLQGEQIPTEVLNDLSDPNVIKIAHNANFERTCLTKWLDTDMDPAQWYCTAVRAATLGLPRSLEAVGEALGLAEDEKKMAVGKRLIQYFAKPCAPTKTNGGRRRNLPHHEPEKWKLYKEYNLRDVETERIIFYKMLPFPEISEEEHRLWELDQRMNALGVEIDVDLVGAIIGYSEQHSADLLEEAKGISKLANPSSPKQAMAWLKRNGVPVQSFNKETVTDLVKTVSDHAVLRFLQIRQELGKTSVAKYDAMQRARCEDNKVRGMLQFYGANRTGRWAGRIVQLQNLPKNELNDLDLARSIVKNRDFELLELLYDSTMDVFSQLIRTAFIAGEGQLFAVADYSAIEARVIAWLAGEEWRIEAFEQGQDIYCASASQMFGVPVKKNGINGHLRPKGKVAELACGYQGGIGAMKRMGGEKMGLTDEEMQEIVDHWRAKSPKIVELWATTEKCAKEAILHPGTVQRFSRGLAFKMIGPHLFARLPSGRLLCYNNARIAKGQMRTEIKYMGQNQTTQKWEEVNTYGGKLVENLTQATARDCLGCAMLRLAEKNLMPSFHIHDEVVIPISAENAEETLKTIEKIMVLDGVPWKEGLPLTADGYLTYYYKKD